MVRAAVAQRVAPAIAFGIRRLDGAGATWFAGREGPETDAPPTGPTTRFDLASLTKALTTTTWVLRLVERAALDLERPIGALVDVEDPRLAVTPLWRLLNHTAGLPAHRRYYEGLGRSTRRSGRFDRARRSVRRMLSATAVDTEPGRAEIYSDPGFLLLQAIAERADGPLHERWPDLPGHGPEQLHFRPSTVRGEPASGYAPTEQCPLRGRLVRGEVHDENAWIMGGVAGHAGLFGNLEAVLAQGRRWLHALRGRSDALGIGPSLARAAIDRRWMHPRGTRVLGWDTPTPGRSSSGRGFGRRAVGHLGFTGTSIWLDPDRGVVMALLTNRVSPSRSNTAIRRCRPRIHDAGWRWLGIRFT